MDGYSKTPNTNPVGAGEGEAVQGGVDVGGEQPLNVEAILECFMQATKMRLKERTQDEYVMRFRHFAQAEGLQNINRRQLAGKMGKELILNYLSHYSKPSWRTMLAMLRGVWLYGLDLPWPIDAVRDVGKLPKVRRGKALRMMWLRRGLMP